MVAGPSPSANADWLAHRMPGAPLDRASIRLSNKNPCQGQGSCQPEAVRSNTQHPLVNAPSPSSSRRSRRTGGPPIHRPDHIRNRVGIDPFDDARIHVSHLKQRRKPGVASTSLTEEHLPHPPIPLIELVSSNDHKVPWADVEKGSLRLHREITVINRHEPPRNQYTCTHSHGDMGLASRQSRWR